MVIHSRKELQKILKEEKSAYISDHLKKRIIYRIENLIQNRIWKFQKSLRYSEYLGGKKGKLYCILFRLSERKRVRLGIRLGIEIAPGSVGKGMIIYHTGVVVNSKAIVGENCVFHGNNCIGNKGNDDNYTPIIGNNVDFGFGSVAIGDIAIGNNVHIGANAVVTKSLPDGAVAVGVPAYVLKRGVGDK